MSTPDNDIELLAGQVWNAPDRPQEKRRAQFDALMKLAKELPPMLDLQLTEDEIEQITSAAPLFGYYLPQMLHDAQREPVPLSPEQIEMRKIYGGDKWSDEEIAAMEAQIKAAPYVLNTIQPQVDLLRRAPAPGESALQHEAPHYGYLLEKKGGGQ